MIQKLKTGRPVSLVNTISGASITAVYFGPVNGVDLFRTPSGQSIEAEYRGNGVFHYQGNWWRVELAPMDSLKVAA
jgi:hypothetical protein